MRQDLAPDRYSVEVQPRNRGPIRIGITRDKAQAIGWANGCGPCAVSVRNVTDGRTVYQRKAERRAMAAGGVA
jgi:hypothetical protein